MPTYIYKCVVCKKERAVEHLMKDDPDIECECGAEMRRVPQSTPFKFRGSGFYGGKK